MFDTLVIAYLFLGGSGAGAAAIATMLLWLFFPETRILTKRSAPSLENVPYLPPYRSLFTAIKRGFVASLALLAIGTLCLFFDLSTKNSVLLLFTQPNMTWITLGSFLLALLLIVNCLIVLGQNNVFCKLCMLAKRWGLLFCMLLSWGVMAYTGLFLHSMGVGVPLWDSLLVPVLFIASSLSAGCAIMLVCAHSAMNTADLRRFFSALIRLDSALLIAELLSLAAFLLDASSRPESLGGFINLTSTDLAYVFAIGLVGLGLLAPLAIEALICSKRLARIGLPTICLAGMLIIGCYSLRVCIVEAGAHPDIRTEFLANIQNSSSFEGRS